MRKRNKFNIGTSVKSKQDRTVDGHLFMSKREAERYKVLKVLVASKEIKDLVLQPHFILQERFTDSTGKKQREIAYFADFQYFDNRTNKIIVEDVKGMRTDVYKIKKKLFLHLYPQFFFQET